MVWAAYVVIIAALFDLFDGMAARILNVSSPVGKELDSLADVVSFGFVPGAILFKLLQINLTAISDNEMITRGIQFLPFTVTLFSAVRLAKFNLDMRQSEYFIGLPTPANTLLIISLPLILDDDKFGLRFIILNPYFLLALSGVMSFLLVAELPLLALKFKNFTWKDNSYQFILILASVILLLILKFASLPLIIFLYVLLSLIKNSVMKNTTTR